MKIKALTVFGNGITGATYTPGYEYEVTKAYGAEYIKAGLAVEVDEPKTEPGKKPKPPAAE